MKSFSPSRFGFDPSCIELDAASSDYRLIVLYPEFASALPRSQFVYSFSSGRLITITYSVFCLFKFLISRSSLASVEVFDCLFSTGPDFLPPGFTDFFPVPSHVDEPSVPASFPDISALSDDDRTLLFSLIDRMLVSSSDQ